MIAYKCKMCGGSLQIAEGQTTAVCEYCGNTLTLPKAGSADKTTLLERADDYRRASDFDKAAQLYERILLEDAEDAEIYWSLVLCTYGIEYVRDPHSRRIMPTINRTRLTSVLLDPNYKKALQLADVEQRTVFEQEAAEIDRIQKNIIAISQKEEPFDIFLCYKETDAQGRRTMESVLANEMYHLLTKEGYKVFFARITLQDKIGSAYEPYIFSALNSSKVMVVVGTSKENFEAPWVRNEWSRFLTMIKNGEDKILIPAYRDMDPYDLPQEFAYLQALNMGSLGFMQDLIYGIKRIIPLEKQTPETPPEAKQKEHTYKQEPKPAEPVKTASAAEDVHENRDRSFDDHPSDTLYDRGKKLMVFSLIPISLYVLSFFIGANMHTNNASIGLCFFYFIICAGFLTTAAVTVGTLTALLRHKENPLFQKPEGVKALAKIKASGFLLILANAGFGVAQFSMNLYTSNKSVNVHVENFWKILIGIYFAIVVVAIVLFIQYKNNIKKQLSPRFVSDPPRAHVGFIFLITVNLVDIATLFKLSMSYESATIDGDPYEWVSMISWSYKMQYLNDQTVISGCLILVNLHVLVACVFAAWSIYRFIVLKKKYGNAMSVKSDNKLLGEAFYSNYSFQTIKKNLASKYTKKDI